MVPYKRCFLGNFQGSFCGKHKLMGDSLYSLIFWCQFASVAIVGSIYLGAWAHEGSHPNFCKTDFSQPHSEVSREYMHRLLKWILKTVYEQEASIPWILLLQLESRKNLRRSFCSTLSEENILAYIYWIQQ